MDKAKPEAMSDEEILVKLDELTKDATRHQQESLRSIIQRHGDVRYLRRCNAPVDVANFRTIVPLSTYEDYSDYINRLADGHFDDHDHDHDQPLLSVDPLVCFFYSSGTSSMKPKLIPYFDSSLSKAASFIAHQGSSAILRRLFPSRSLANKFIFFMYADNTTTSKGGFQAMAASSYPLLRSNADPRILARSSSPREVIIGSDIESQMYFHLLCGLRNYESIDGIHAPYAVGLIKAMAMLETKWEHMCEDLENGFPSPKTPGGPMRDSVIDALGGPQVDISARVRSICGEKNWCGIVKKLWPNIRYARCVATGSMKQYFPKLEHYFEGTPLLGGDYFASECCVAINLDPKQPPETTRYVMLPTAAYFEFLPFDPNEIEAALGKTVEFSGVEIGKMYEVVVTTYRGLYRYRLGDIVRVVGFHNSSPEIEFVMRAPRALTDIITEADLCSAVKSSRLGTEVTEFASFYDSELVPNQLKVVVEVREESVLADGESIRSVCSWLDDNLGNLYKVKRKRGEVGPLSLTVVSHGSFDALLHLAIEKGTPASQYKPPKIIRNQEIISFLESSALLTVCSDSN